MKAYAVYGPPGCGKTTEMLRRVEAAKTHFKVNEIGFLSFTKAGAAEALKRLNISRSDKICTIHSLMYRMNNISAPAVVDNLKLRRFGDRTGFRFRGQSNDTGEQMEIGDQYIAVLGKCANRMTPLREEYYESDRPGDWGGFRFFAESYESWKQANGYVDFNDMLKLYLQFPSPTGIKCLFVDEAQDLSDLQWAVIDKIIEVDKPAEVHIAGDDDQAIYEWSGANTHGMAEFEERYGAERSVLRLSWRVPALVHSVAMGVVNTIENRVPKEYLPRADSAGQVRRIAHFDPKSVSHGADIMILCRNFMTRKQVEDELIRHRIPYRNEGGMPGLFASRVAEAIRVFRKLEAGESISQTEIDKLVAASDERTRRDIQTRDFKAILQRGYIRSFVIPPTLVDFYRDADFSTEPTIRLSTIHSAKGREAERVILHTGLTDKTYRDMDKSQSHFDAEARVWYVGVTRAKHSLEILEGENGYPIK